MQKRLAALDQQAGQEREQPAEIMDFLASPHYEFHAKAVKDSAEESQQARERLITLLQQIAGAGKHRKFLDDIEAKEKNLVGA